MVTHKSLNLPPQLGITLIPFSKNDKNMYTKDEYSNENMNVPTSSSYFPLEHLFPNSWGLLGIKSYILYLGVTSVIVTGTELIWQLVESAENFLVEEAAPLVPAESWKKPGAVSSFSFSRMFLESMSTTWLMSGLRFATPWVQKKATLMCLMTSSSGNSPNSGSTSSKSFPPSWSCHAYWSRQCLLNRIILLVNNIRASNKETL